MKIVTYSYYHKETGVFINEFMQCHGDPVGDPSKLKAPDGYCAIVGQFDPGTHRVDISTGTVIDYQPPQPSNDHEWNTKAKCWHVKDEIAAKQREIATTKLQLQELDARHLRALDEVIADPTNVVARDILDSVRKLKEQLRKKLV